jgi:CrcB protein
MVRVALVMLGGAVGSLARYLLVTFIHSKSPGPFPFGTFVVNITGSFLVGVAITVIGERWMGNTNLRVLLVVGVLGGYTTFSSLEYEVYAAAQSGYRAVALTYAVASAVCGYLAVVLGVWVAARRIAP